MFCRLVARLVQVTSLAVITQLVRQCQTIYNPQTALSTHYFNVNYGATFLSQAAQVDSSLGPRYIWSRWGLCDNVSATIFKGPERYTIYMGNSFIRSNQQA